MEHLPVAWRSYCVKPNNYRLVRNGINVSAREYRCIRTRTHTHTHTHTRTHTHARILLNDSLSNV